MTETYTASAWADRNLGSYVDHCRRAKEAAGGKDVAVSGVEIGRQLLQAGHLDEIWIHVVPVLFGSGTRLYEQVGGQHIQLDLVEAIPTPDVTHLNYRVRT